MTRSKCIRVEASVILHYAEEQGALPPSLPDAADVERAISSIVLKHWRKAGKSPTLRAITGGRFLITLCKEPARRRDNQAKPRDEQERCTCIRQSISTGLDSAPVGGDVIKADPDCKACARRRDNQAKPRGGKES